jgi:Transcription factor WhiB.
MTAMPGRLMAPRMPDFLRRGRPACGDYDPELFYPTSEANMAAVEMAKSVCRRCPLRADCLSYALETGDDWGIWAGTTARERRRIRLGVA